MFQNMIFTLCRPLAKFSQVHKSQYLRVSATLVHWTHSMNNSEVQHSTTPVQFQGVSKTRSKN